MKTSRRGLLIGAAGLMAGACAPAVSRSVITTGAVRRRVVVIGAGIAGLTVATDLAGSGHDVVVLEAQERPGGRILTIRAPFPEGLYVEAGATHVVGDPELLRLCASAGVEVKRTKPPRGLATITYFDGKRARYAGDDEPPERAVLSAEERALGPEGCMAKYFADVKGVDPASPWPPAALAAEDRRTGAQMLAARGASPGYVAELAGSILPEDVGVVSGAYVLREVAGFWRDMASQGGGRVVGGTDRLPAALASRLGSRVTYGAEVKRIAETERGVRVAFVRRGEAQEIEAERVVCAIPYSVLRHMELPAFSARKQRAIRELSMVSLARVMVQVERRVWIDRGESGDAETDLPSGLVRDETKLQPGTAGVLGALVSGARARQVAALPERERVRAFLEDAEKVHPGVKAAFRGGVTKCWDEDPFARGAFACFRPGQMGDFGAALAGAEGRVHFAGDHTSHRPGWMHGAVASAKRVGREIDGVG